MKYALLKF